MTRRSLFRLLAAAGLFWPSTLHAYLVLGGVGGTGSTTPFLVTDDDTLFLTTDDDTLFLTAL